MPRVALAIFALVLAACGMVSNEPAACRAGIASAHELLQLPVFAPLAYHKRVEFEIRRGMGYDVWADARFEYRSALEFSLVPRPGAANDDELCVQAVSLKIATPADDSRRALLRAFVRAAAERASTDAAALQSKLDEMMASGAPYRAIVREPELTVSAGHVSHPTRGEFFVVEFSKAR